MPPVVPPFGRAASTPPETATASTATTSIVAPIVVVQPPEPSSGIAPGLPFKLKFVFDHPLEVKLRPVVMRRQSSASCYSSNAAAAAHAQSIFKRSKASRCIVCDLQLIWIRHVLCAV